MTGALKFWKLAADGNKYMSFIPHELSYFDENFVGRPMSHAWHSPRISIAGKSKKTGDFVSWMLSAPVVSEKAMSVLEPVCGAYVEFLPFCKVRNKTYFAVNVMEKKAYIDVSRSDLTVSGEKYILNDDYAYSLPPIFKSPGTREQVFVTEKFGRVIVDNELRGALMLDPSLPTMRAILRGDPLNCFPEIQD